MASSTIPLLNIPRQRLTTVVDNQEIEIAVWYQPQGGSWYITLEYPVETPLLKGRRINLDSPILTNYPRAGFRGNLVCRALSETHDEPGITPWGQTHVLRYET